VSDVRVGLERAATYRGCRDGGSDGRPVVHRVATLLPFLLSTHASSRPVVVDVKAGTAREAMP
jgi:hypothetical protein